MAILTPTTGGEALMADAAGLYQSWPEPLYSLAWEPQERITRSCRTKDRRNSVKKGTKHGAGPGSDLGHGSFAKMGHY